MRPPPFYAHAVAFVLLGTLRAGAEPPDGFSVVFMEPVGVNLPLLAPTYRPVIDPDRRATYERWLDNPSARGVIDLYQRAAAVMRRRGQGPDRAPTYYVALVPGGNHADMGFKLRTDEGVRDFSKQPYVKLAPEERAFDNTFVHETGHVVLAMLNGNDGIPRRRLASIPHTTAALTDRGTAFDEGFAIHLETVAAHFASDPELRARYHRERVLCGPAHEKKSEYDRAAVDLMTFAQTTARYLEVRENSYAFAPAFRGPDYLRVQLEKSRDFATLRDANQLLQCEGFYATFFFTYLMRGNELPAAEKILARQDRMTATLAEMFAAKRPAHGTPYLLRFVRTHLRLYPDEAAEVADLLNDLSHGVFVDPDAAALWRDYYLAAVRLDLDKLPTDRLRAARERWRQAILDDPGVLESRLGPELPCGVPARRVRLGALGVAKPLMFDLNTVEEGVLRMIPNIADDEVTRWLAERARGPFSSADDFKKRAALDARTLKELRL